MNATVYEVIETFESHIEDVKERLALRSNVIDGTPFVIRVEDGLYLQSKDDGFGVNNIIAKRIACFAKETALVNAAEVAKQLNKKLGEDVYILHINDALREELRKSETLLAKLKERYSKAVA